MRSAFQLLQSWQLQQRKMEQQRYAKSQDQRHKVDPFLLQHRARIQQRQASRVRKLFHKLPPKSHFEVFHAKKIESRDVHPVDPRIHANHFEIQQLYRDLDALCKHEQPGLGAAAKQSTISSPRSPQTNRDARSPLQPYETHHYGANQVPTQHGRYPNPNPNRGHHQSSRPQVAVRALMHWDRVPPPDALMRLGGGSPNMPWLESSSSSSTNGGPPTVFRSSVASLSLASKIAPHPHPAPNKPPSARRWHSAWAREY